MIFCLGILEVVGVHLIINATMDPGPLKHVIQWGIFGLSLYGIILLSGDFKMLIDAHHVFRPDSLTLGLGVRGHGTIRYDQIESISVGEIDVPVIPKAELKKDPELEAKVKATGFFSPFDQPNMRINLKEPVEFENDYFLWEQRVLKYINLYHSSPEKIKEQIEKGISYSSSEFHH